MFKYLGSKGRYIDYYPFPQHEYIIEPFAGSARYSLKYWDRKIIINEKEEIIYNLWKYLQKSTAKEIMNLPVFDVGEEIVHSLEEVRWLINLCSNIGSLKVGTNKVSKTGKSTYTNKWRSQKEKIAKSLYKIKHWDIRLGDYLNLENMNATWFIDPPYEQTKDLYPEK